MRVRLFAFAFAVSAIAQPAAWAGAPAAAGAEAALPWVSPSRCLQPCDLDVTEALVQIDDLGRPSAQGKHRVARAVQEPLEALIRAAARAKQRMRVSSAHRSYERQADLFARTPQIGRAARPGHSEHQTGAAVDLRLGSSAVVAWLAAHAHELGFVRSYPPGKQKATGYPPESWHVRFVGIELATLAHARGLSLEELLRAGLARGISSDCRDCPLPASRALPCGPVTAEGSCDGDVLSFCFDGVLAQIDCAPSRQACRPVVRGHDCVPLPPAAAKEPAASPPGAEQQPGTRTMPPRRPRRP